MYINNCFVFQDAEMLTCMYIYMENCKYYHMLLLCKNFNRVIHIQFNCISRNDIPPQ